MHVPMWRTGRPWRRAGHVGPAGGPTTQLLQSGPFRLSRNPLGLGLIALDVALSLLAPSAWALVLVPVGVAVPFRGAIRPEERYLTATFGPVHDASRARVRRWLQESFIARARPPLQRA